MWWIESAASLWLQILLPSKIPNARILMFGYDASVTDWWGMVSKSRVRNHIMNLLAAVVIYREENNSMRLLQRYFHKAKLTRAEQAAYHIYLP